MNHELLSREAPAANRRLIARLRSLLAPPRLIQMAENQRRVFFFILLLALALRVGFALTLPAQILWADGHSYEKIALNLLTTGGFGTLEDNAVTVPMQPILIAAVYAIFGEQVLPLRLLWALMGALTCALAYLLGRKLINPVVGALAGLALAVYPYYIYVATMFEYPQTPFIMFMALCFLGLVSFDAAPRWKTLLGAGLCLGLAILSVPTAMLALPLLALWVGSRLSPRVKGAAAMAIFLCAALAPVGMWAARNYTAYQRFVLINCAGGISFWKGNNETYAAYGKAGIESTGEDAAQPKSTFLAEAAEVHRQAQAYGPVESWIVRERMAWQKGIAFVREDPLRFAQLTGEKFLRFWSPLPDAVSNNGQNTPARTFIAIVSYGPLPLLGLLGMLLGLREWRRFVLFYAYICALTAAYSLFLPTTRYRLPIDFLLALFAAMFVDTFIRPEHDRTPLRDPQRKREPLPPERRKLSIIVPAYNEYHNIDQVIAAVQAVELPAGVEREIVLVDDGSNDGTSQKLAQYKGVPNITVHHSILNFGKGTAVRIGLRYATGDIILFQDGDMELDPNDYPKLIQPILDGKADVVYGSRFRGKIENMKFANWLANRILTFAVNLLFGARISDEATAYKVFRADVLKNLTLYAEGFEFCPEVTAKVLRSGLEIYEVPINYVGRSAEEGKKIKWHDGLYALLTLLRCRLFRRA
jgi:dolichol-phosphate mannosyltransferase